VGSALMIPTVLAEFGDPLRQRMNAQAPRQSMCNALTRRKWPWWTRRRFSAIVDESVAAPDRWAYTDVAIAPQQRDEFERLLL